MASRSIEDLHVSIRDKCIKHKLLCAQRGIELLVYCTYRSGAEQDHLYAQGRTMPGKIVTYAKSGQSKHNHMEGGRPASLAYDCVPLTSGKPAWGDKNLYAIVGELGERCGLSWAGRWKRFKEYPHFEVTL